MVCHCCHEHLRFTAMPLACLCSQLCHTLYLHPLLGFWMADSLPPSCVPSQCIHPCRWLAWLLKTSCHSLDGKHTHMLPLTCQRISPALLPPRHALRYAGFRMGAWPRHCWQFGDANAAAHHSSLHCFVCSTAAAPCFACFACSSGATGPCLTAMPLAGVPNTWARSPATCFLDGDHDLDAYRA